MRVLFYVESFPIRNSQTHFDDVARKFLSLLSTDNRMDMRLYANAKTLEALGNTLVDPHAKRIIRSTPQEEDLFKRYLLDWGSEGIPTWLNLMAGDGEVTEDYLNVLRRIWRIFPFEVIIHWGENGAITRFLQERPVTRIGMELGCTRAPFFESVIMDPYGTNGAAVTPKLTLADLRDIVDGRQMSRHHAMMAYSQNLETLTYEHQFLPLPNDLATAALKADRLAFLPLQLYDDANLLRFSPYNTVTEVVLDVVPKLAERGYTTIIKPHPGSKHRQNATIANFIAHAELREWANQIIWCERSDISYNNSQLINLCDFVVTVNSSVGFESLYYDKPVAVLGDAVYKPKDFFPTLDQLLDGTFDYESYKEGAGYLRQFFLGGYLQPDRVRTDAPAFSDRVRLMDFLCKQKEISPKGFAKGFYNALSPAQESTYRSAMFYGLSTPGQNEFESPSPKNTLQVAPTISDQCTEFVPIARRIMAYTGIRDLDTFDTWLDELWTSKGQTAELITASGIVDGAYYLNKYPDVLDANIDPIFHYANYGIHEGRSPRASVTDFYSTETLSQLKTVSPIAINLPIIPEYPLTSEEDISRSQQLASIRTELASSSNTIAVVAHLYYKDLVPEIMAALKAIPESFDLIVTMPNWGTRKIREIVKEQHPNAVFYEALNRGRDIGPFVDLLPIIIDKHYHTLLKIQTKRGYYRAGKLLPKYGELWRKDVFGALLGNKQRVAEIITSFRERPELSMVGPSNYLLSLKKYPYHDQGELSRALLNNPQGETFFAGTMFWVNPQCLRPLVEPSHFSIKAFAPETGSNDGATAHLIERFFGQAAQTYGCIAGASNELETPLDFLLDPIQISINDYLTERLKNQGNVVSTRALAW